MTMRFRVTSRAHWEWLWWRLRSAIHYWRDSADALNRRVEVENTLLLAAAGRRPLLTREECRAMALRLGVPGWARKEDGNADR